MAAYGTYPKEGGGTPTRIILPYAFTPEAMELIKRASAFLFEIKSINAPTLRPDAVMPEFAQAVLKERGLTAPLGEIKSAARFRLHGPEVGAFAALTSWQRSPNETFDARRARGGAGGNEHRLDFIRASRWRPSPSSSSSAISRTTRSRIRPW